MGEKNINSIYTGMGEMMKVYIVMEDYNCPVYVADSYEKAYDYARRNYNSLLKFSITEWEVR